MNPPVDEKEHGLTGVVVLGATGSIGQNTLDVLDRHRDVYRVVALTSNTQVDRLLEQCLRYRPEFVAMADRNSADELSRKIRDAGLPVKVLSGEQGLSEVAALPQANIVMAAIVGAAGLLPTLAAVKAGKKVLLANKEPLVMCGHIFIEEARRSGALLLPIDSEHNAIFQCMPAGYRAGQVPSGVKRILLTGSGGPFRSHGAETLENVTPDEACAHPNWDMGRKISVDSATLMNKGLEVIEACWLFNVSPSSVEVVIHPQSIIHSMVEYVDGSVLAQLGNPDMRTPIAHALAWPERIESGVDSLDLYKTGKLEFEIPDTDRFPCLKLAYEAAQKGGTAPVVLNAANEFAVQAFLDKKIKFTDIHAIIRHTMTTLEHKDSGDLETVLEMDARARNFAREYVDHQLRQGRRMMR